MFRDNRIDGARLALVQPPGAALTVTGSEFDGNLRDGLAIDGRVAAVIGSVFVENGATGLAIDGSGPI